MLIGLLKGPAGRGGGRGGARSLARLLLQGGGQSSEHQRLEVLAEKGEEEGRQGWPTPAGLLVRSVKRCVALLGLFFLISSVVLEPDCQT